MTTPITIPKNINVQDDRNFQFLREEGLKYIEQFASQIWTDYNTSDPGITLLEVLCYAITDLGLRIGMPMENLLTGEGEGVAEMHQQFHSALRILPSAPVTELDYKKLIVNIKGIKNAWFYRVEPEVYVNFGVVDETTLPTVQYQPFDKTKKKVKQFRLKGLHRILIELEESVQALPQTEREAATEQLKEQVRQVYHQNRNLCEDLVDVEVVRQQGVVVCGEIELQPNADGELVNARIFQAIQNYLTPSVKFYSLKEMLQDKKKSIEEIYEGPLFKHALLDQSDLLEALLGNTALRPLIDQYEDLIRSSIATETLMDDIDNNLEQLRKEIYDAFLFHGFIDDDELRDAGLRREVRASDLIRIIMEVEGVKEVRDIYLNLCETDPEDAENCNCGEVTDEINWRLCLDEGFQPIICWDGSNFRNYKDLLPINVRKNVVRQLWEQFEAEEAQGRFGKRVEDLPMPLGNYVAPGFYESVQNQLPDTYGVNQAGLPPTPESERPQRQAKAWQLKAYLLFFDQIMGSYFAHLGNIRHLLSADNAVRQTYFTQVVQNVRDFEVIYKDFVSEEETESALTGLLSRLDDYARRKHLMLDHLIARFSERFSDYVYSMYELFEDTVDDLLIGHKVDFLKDYPAFSSRRGQGFNYYDPNAGIWDTDNVSGMQRRIARLAGFDTFRRENLAGLAHEFFKVDNLEEQNQFGWRIRDDQGRIILESTGRFTNKEDAFAAIETAVELAKNRDNYQIASTNHDPPRLFYNLHADTGNNPVVAFGRLFFSGDVQVPGENEGDPPQTLTAEDRLNTAIDETVAFLTEFDEENLLAKEGIYVIENILLRPDISRMDKPLPTNVAKTICIENDGSFCEPLDPYSFRITVVLPGWTRRFGDMNFRPFLERLIRMETPAPVLARICWISRDKMNDLEEAYQAYLQARAQNPSQQAPDSELIALNEVLGSLHNVYWTGTLHDCVDEGDDEDDNPFILGNTFLGTL